MTVVVVPCYNEALRLDAEGFRALAEHPGVSLLFVDDGSADDTLAVLERLRARWPGNVDVLALDKNGGKGEAVRRGLLAALASGADAVGYLDADLSTPAAEMLRLVERLATSDATAVLGARVGLLGTDIHRKASRHYLGRVFATFASLALDLRIYDTQCGAKVFRAGPALQRALAEPFASRWAFDVELLGRLINESGSSAGIVEVPLTAWRDVAGSKLGVKGMARAAIDLAQVATRLARARKKK